jgi:hypothetical protein
MRQHPDMVRHAGEYDPSGSWCDPADRTVTVNLHNVSRSDRDDIITENFNSTAIPVDLPAVNNGGLSFLAGIPEEISENTNNQGRAFQKPPRLDDLTISIGRPSL